MEPRLRLVHIDRELAALSRIQPHRRMAPWWWAVDHWLDKRLELTAPYRRGGLILPVIPGRMDVR